MTNGNSSSYDVFLSHGSPDKPWVRQLHAHLEALGVRVYLDEVAIEAGDNWVRHLSNGIERASTLVIIVSAGSTDRPWVEQEWTSFMATHGPRKTIIPVTLDHAQLPAFLRPSQAIHAIDRDVEMVAARIARAVGKGNGASSTRSAPPPPYTGQSLFFTIVSVDDSDRLEVTSTDGTLRVVTAPWRQGNKFAIALMEFEQLTRTRTLDDVTRARLVAAAQTVGGALFDVLFSDDALRSAFAQATAPGARPVVAVQSGDDVLLSLPWELLFHESRFLVRDGVLDVVRSTTGAVQFETQLTPPTAPFTVVTHVSAPEGSDLSYEDESYRITHALTDHCPQTATELGTLDDLVDTVTRTKPRGIHFSGHGDPGGLVFEDDEGFEAPVTTERVVTALRQRGDGLLPPFFFLASCHGNTPAEPAEGKSGSASSAAQLHREGVTEVVGYYGPIGDELSTRAEEAFYAAIAAGERTRLAVAKARAALQRTFDGDPSHRPSSRDVAPVRSSHNAAAGVAHVAPFAWAQLVFYHRGADHPLGTPASQEKLRQREASLQRTYRNVADRAFLATGFIGRRRELHELRRRRKRGDRVFVLQGLGGLGKTTLAGHLLPLLADAQHTVTIWCRRSEDESDQAESLVGQLLSYARERSIAGFEEFVGGVDRVAGDDAVHRFAAFLQFILAKQPKVPLVVYFDNLESLLHGPDTVALETAPDSEAFGAWRSDALRRLWRTVAELTRAVGQLYVVASCRYRNDDLMAPLLSVSPFADVDLFRLMAWFPALRRLSTRTRGQLAGRLSGHPRSVEHVDALIAASINDWESSNGEWTSPASHDEDACGQEWERLVAPVLPTVQERIWSDLLLAALWDRVLDERAQRMLFRMTLLRHPWDDGLLPCLGDPEDDEEAVRRTARTLEATSLLERIDLTVIVGDHKIRRPFHAVHADTAAFVRSRFGAPDDFVVATHRRIGSYLEDQARTPTSLSPVIDAGYHLFEAGEYDRAFVLLGLASQLLRAWGRVREGLQLLLPFLDERIRARMTPTTVSRSMGSIGLAYAELSETRRAIEQYEQALAISREIGDRHDESKSLGNLGLAYASLGERRRAIDLYTQQLAIVREFGDRDGESNALGNLGSAYLALGDTRRAIDFYTQQLPIVREIGYLRGEGSAIGGLGTAYAALGETQRAIEFYTQQLAIVGKIHDQSGEGQALGNLGSAYYALGDIRRAIELHERALAISRKIGDRYAEGQDLGNLGTAYGALGERRRAIDLFEQRIAIAKEIGDRRGEGVGLSNLAFACAALGERQRAVDYYEQALAIGRAIDDPQMIRISQAGLIRCIRGGVIATVLRWLAKLLRAVGIMSSRGG